MTDRRIGSRYDEQGRRGAIWAKKLATELYDMHHEWDSTHIAEWIVRHMEDAWGYFSISPSHVAAMTTVIVAAYLSLGGKVDDAWDVLGEG